MKASIAGELLLLVGIVALAYFLYLQQDQLVSLELEVDRVKGALGATVAPVPPASEEDAAPVPAAPPTRQRQRKAATSG